MKKIVCLLVAALMLIPCAPAEEIAMENGVLLAVDAAVEYDLDGDGASESLTLKKTGFDDDPGYRLTLIAGDGAVYNYDMDIMYLRSGCITDIDGDGMAETLVSGDFYSDDFYTWCFRYDGVDMTALTFDYAGRISEEEDGMPDAGNGAVVAVGNGSLTLMAAQDIMGTWMATRSFTLSDGHFSLEQDGLWEIRHDLGNPETWEYNQLTLIQPLKVTFDGGAAGELQVGESFLITASDKKSIVHFLMEDGRIGSFAVAPDAERGYGFMINGISERDYFEYVPYAD